MNTYKTKIVIGLLTVSCLILGFSFPAQAQAAEYCSDDYYIDVTLPNQARWDMCWEHRNREGIVLHKIHYTPRNGERRMVLNEAAVAQIHVPYDDNGARYHDVSDYGLGSNYMTNLRGAECPDGRLLKFGNKNVICQQVAGRDSAFSFGNEHLQGDALSLFSVSKIGAYNYIPTWRFLDDGSIEPAIGATGALQRFGNLDKEQHGWLIEEQKVGLAHLHNFFWKLDFDLAGTHNNDYVEELNFTSSNGRITRENTRFSQEAARRVSASTMRRWLVRDGDMTNDKGQPISYEIRLFQAEHQDIGPDTEPFTHYDFYVTRRKTCELFASRNPTTGGCATNLASFVNGENIEGQDIVVWPSTTFYHMPRAEDAPIMDAHWSFISVTPRDWHNKNPLSDAAETNAGTTDPDNGSTPPDDNNTGGDNPGSEGGNSENGSSNTPVTTVIYQDDFEGANNWTLNANGTDSAELGQWELGQPQATNYQGLVLQNANPPSGGTVLVTGASAGRLIGSNDVDNGVTSVRSSLIDLRAEGSYTLKLAYYFAHLRNASDSDFLRITAITEQGARQVLLYEAGGMNDRAAQWQNLSVNLDNFAGTQISLLIEAADGGAGSIVEAAVDNIRIEKITNNTDQNNEPGDSGSNNNTSGSLLYSESFEDQLDWTLNPAADDQALTGQWSHGVPQATQFQGSFIQPGRASAGSQALMTGHLAGTTIGTYDIDGGKTAIRSPEIKLPGGHGYRLQMDYYLAHLWNATNADYLIVSVESAGMRKEILSLRGTSVTVAADWKTLTYDLSEYANSSIYLHIEASDGGAGSIVEAAIDNIRITYQ